MRSRPNARHTLVALGAAATCALATGCSTGSSYNTSQWAAQPALQIRAGIGDSLGNALFLRQVQLAKSVQFQTSPTFAAELTE